MFWLTRQSPLAIWEIICLAVLNLFRLHPKSLSHVGIVAVRPSWLIILTEEWIRVLIDQVWDWPVCGNNRSIHHALMKLFINGKVCHVVVFMGDRIGINSGVDNKWKLDISWLHWVDGDQTWEEITEQQEWSHHKNHDNWCDNDTENALLTPVNFGA